MYFQSNLIISTNSETNTFKNITLKNKTISNRGGSRVPAKSKAEVLTTIVTSRTLLTKVGMSSIIYFAELLDTPSKIKLHKNINCNITKQKKNAIRESLILISFSVKYIIVLIKIYFGFIITIIFIYYSTIVRSDILKAKFFLRFWQFCNTVHS